MSATVEFWYEFASTYSYPAAMRIERLAREAAAPLVWRPFLLGPIFHKQGWNDSPFNIYPAKGRYMWRDLERQCAKEELAFRRPSRFPRAALLAARVACLGAAEPWCGEFTRRVYAANFAEDREIAEPAVVAAILGELGLDAAGICERAQAAENKDRLREQTEEAERRGVFGAPSFTVAGELFWGNDRLEQAIAWARR